MDDFSEYLFVMIGFAVVIIAIVVIAVIFSKKAKKKRSTCPKCNTVYDYDNDIAWEVYNVKTEDKRQIANVNIRATCHNCGEVKKLSRSYTVANIDANGQLHEHNLESLVRKDFLN